MAVFFIVSFIPASRAKSVAPGVDEYETEGDRALESLTGHIADENHFTVKNDGGVTATVTHVAYKDGDMDYVDVPNITILPNETASLDIERENYARLGVFSARGWLYPVSSGAGGSAGENYNVATTVEGNTEPDAPVTVVVLSEKRVFYTSADENGHFQVTVENLKSRGPKWSADVYKADWSGSWSDWRKTRKETSRISRREYRRTHVGDTQRWGWDDGHRPTDKKVVVSKHKEVRWRWIGWWPYYVYFKTEAYYHRHWERSKSWEYKGTENFEERPEDNASVDYRNITQSKHELKVVAGDANRNENADGPQAGGWRGYAENSYESSLSVGEHKSVDIPLKYDPFNLKLSEHSDTLTREWKSTKSLQKVWTETKNVRWEDYSSLAPDDPMVDSYRETSGWQVSDVYKTTDHSKTFETFWKALIKKMTTGGSITSIPRYDWDWRVDWQEPQKKSKTYDEKSGAKDKQDSVGGSITKVWDSTDEWVDGHWEGGWDYKYDWTRYERDWYWWPYPHWGSWYEVANGSVTKDSYKGSGWTNGGHSWQGWKKVYNFDSYDWDPTDEWVDGHWEGGWDYKLTWIKSVPHSKTYESHRDAYLKALATGGSVTKTDKERVDTDYRVDWTTKRLTGYDIKRKIWNEVTHKRWKRRYSFAGWSQPETSTGVTVASKNNYEGTVGLSADSSGVISALDDSELNLASTAHTELRVSPIGSGASSHSVEVRAADSDGETVETSLYTLNLTGDKPGPDTWTTTDTTTERVSKPGAPEEHVLTVLKEGPGSTDPSAGAYTYTEGTPVTVTANPDSSATFDKWTDGSGAKKSEGPQISVLMNSDVTRKAHFKKVAQSKDVVNIKMVKVTDPYPKRAEEDWEDLHASFYIYDYYDWEEGRGKNKVASGISPTSVSLSPGSYQLWSDWMAGRNNGISTEYWSFTTGKEGGDVYAGHGDSTLVLKWYPDKEQVLYETY